MKYCVGQNGGAYSLGVKFQKTASFLVCLTQKVIEVLEKYLQNIARMSVKVYRGSKVLKLKGAHWYPSAPKTTFLTQGY